MSRLLYTVADLLRLRAGPQDLPSSWVLTALVLTVFLLQGLITSQSLGGSNQAAQTALSVLAQFIAVALLLRVRGIAERTQQTLLALSATGIALGLVAYPLLMLANPEVNQPLLGLVWFAIFGWSLAVDANIFRHALGVTLSTGVLIAVMLLAVTYVVLELAFA